jgi:RNA polymerase sigma-70 factor (ECF subfamily)
MTTWKRYVSDQVFTVALADAYSNLMNTNARSGIFLVASPDAANLTDDQLVQRVVGGEVSLFEALMRRYNQRLYRTASAIVGTNDAEDVVQQAYLDAFVNLVRFEGRSSVATWLSRIVVNRALAVIASERRHAIAEAEPHMDAIEDPEAIDADRLATREELLRALETAIAELPAGCRAAFVLRDIESLSTREAAELLGITEEALKVRLHRARAIMKQRLGREVPELVEDVLAFGLVRCDRMVLRVLGAVAPHLVPEAPDTKRELVSTREFT